MSIIIEGLSKLQKDTIAIWEDDLVCHKTVNGSVIGVQRFIFTYGILLDLNNHFYRQRYCFDSLQNAIGFYNDYDGSQVPIVGIDGCTAIK